MYRIAADDTGASMRPPKYMLKDLDTAADTKIPVKMLPAQAGTASGEEHLAGGDFVFPGIFQQLPAELPRQHDGAYLPLQCYLRPPSQTVSSFTVRTYVLIVASARSSSVMCRAKSVICLSVMVRIAVPPFHVVTLILHKLGAHSQIHVERRTYLFLARDHAAIGCKCSPSPRMIEQKPQAAGSLLPPVSYPCYYYSVLPL